MLLERVENRRVVAFELDLGDPSYIHIYQPKINYEQIYEISEEMLEHTYSKLISY